MTSSRRSYSRARLLQLRGDNAAFGPPLPRHVRRALWYLGLLAPRLPPRHVSAVTQQMSNMTDPPGGAGDQEVHQHRTQAVPDGHLLRFGTFNCRTLKADWRKAMLAHLASNTRLDLVMLQEVSIVSNPGIQHEDMGAGWTLIYTTADARGRGGVGALVGPKLRDKICCVSLGSRILRIDLKLKDRCAHLFCVYSPTAAHPDEANDFYECLSGHLDTLPQRNSVIVMGDLNAVMRRSPQAPYAAFHENANTATLLDFVTRHDLLSINTCFRKPLFRLATFMGCKRRRHNDFRQNATTRLAQLDHILIRRRERRRVTNCDTIRTLSLKSDHKLLYCDFHLRDPLFRPPKKRLRPNFDVLQEEDHCHRFTANFLSVLTTSDYTDFCTAIRTAINRSIPSQQPPRNGRPVWESDAAVATARSRVERLRREGRREDALEAEARLAQIFKERQHAAIEGTIASITAANPASKCNTVWTAVRKLTGRRKRGAINIIGDSPAERKNAIKDFFAAAVNATPPSRTNTMKLPSEVSLPSTSDFNDGPITEAEVMRLAKVTPGGKAAGPDGIPAEVLRIPTVAREVVRVMNDVLRGQPAPSEWTTAHIIGIPKKPGTARLEDHRGISMMSCVAKLFNKVLLTRIQPVLDPFLRREQNGFRPHRGTTTHILALRRVLEEARLHKTSLVCVFVDFRKAFDSISRGALAEILLNYNMPPLLVNAVMALYSNTKAMVLTPDGPTDPFPTTSGVLQGDTLAPFLFVVVLDWVLRTAIPSDTDGFLLRRRTSSRHPEKRLSVLAYADDLVLLSSTPEGAQRMLTNLARTAETVGLQVNTNKSEILTIPDDLDATIKCPDESGLELNRCSIFRYLGGTVPSVAEDLTRRRGLAWAAFRNVRVILQSDSLCDRLRSLLFKAVVETVLLFNAETWTLTEALRKRLDAAHAALLRATFKVHYPQRVSNEDLYSRANLVPPSIILRDRRLKLTGHVIRGEGYCPEPLQDLLFLSAHGPRRRGQARARRYPDNIFSDAKAPDQQGAIAFVRALALQRAI
jgi:exonuclease III